MDMKYGAIILCGGKSTRMGHDKASLPFGSETMLQRMVRLLSEVIEQDRIVLVAAESQILPQVSALITIARDKHPDRGPLEGLAAGLRAIDQTADAVYVTSCDAPLLVNGFIRAMFERLGDHDVAVPHDGQHDHPLAAVYRTSVLAQVEQLLAAGKLSLRSLLQAVNTLRVPVEELRSVDPDLSTLANLNYPVDYHASLSVAGFPQQQQ